MSKLTSYRKNYKQLNPEIAWSLRGKYGMAELARLLNVKYERLESLYRTGTFWIAPELYDKIMELER